MQQLLKERFLFLFYEIYFGKPKLIFMYLEKLIGSGTKVSVLNVLINNPDSEFFEKELAGMAFAAVSEVNRQLPELVEIGLICLKKIGKQKLYSINKKHFLFASLKNLFVDLNNVFLSAAKKITKHAVLFSKNLDCVLLVGSVAEKKVRSELIKEPSDIDLIFIVNNENNKKKLFNELIAFINKETANCYGIISFPLVISRKQYLQALEKKEPFFIEAQAKGIELHGKKPRRFN